MSVRSSRAVRLTAVLAAVTIVTAFSRPPATPPAKGMTFRLKMVLRHAPTSGRPPRAITLLGHGQFANGLGRVDIDSVDAPAAFRKGDFIIIRDSLNSYWARPSDLRVRKMNAPLVNPLEGISERLISGTGSPSSLKVDLDTVSLDENVNGMATRHYRITADAVYPVGSRSVTQKVVLEQWLAKSATAIMNPFGSRIRGLPDVPMSNGAYREFIRTLSAANKLFGDAVTVRTLTTTSYTYGPGLGEDYYQTVDITELQSADIDPKAFELGPEYTKKPPQKR